MTVSAIIVAAGSGVRMKSDRPKQYLELGGMPLVSRTLKVFDDHPAVENLFLVVPAADFAFCRSEILSAVPWKKTIHLVPGGKRRQDSVHEGLKAAARYAGVGEIVLIHDGVRPFVPPDMITACIACAKESGACILGVPASDTLKRVDAGGVVFGTLSRETVWLAQTPQAFSMDLITAAFEHAAEMDFSTTDDAAVVEFYGRPVRVIPGSRRNIKITTPEDLDFALALLRLAGEMP